MTFIWKRDLNRFAKFHGRNSTPRIDVSEKQIPVQPKHKEGENEH